MKLKDLKKLIKEEYSEFMDEQPTPSVAVSDTDVDAGDGDSEDTLRQIYDMLKDYFEDGDEADDADKADDADDGDDMDDMDDEAPGDIALQERFKKLANIIKG